MRVEVVRSGGFAGIPRHAVLDTAGRPDADRLETLARAAVAPPASGASGPVRTVPDGFRYEITAGDRTIRCADPHLTDAQRELITTLLGEGA